MTSYSNINLNLPIYEQAAEWLIELREGEVDTAIRERLDAWFRASPEHIRAYLELSSIWEEGADPDLDRIHGTVELIARARGRSNVVAINANSVDSPENVNESSLRDFDTPFVSRSLSAQTSDGTSANDPSQKTPAQQVDERSQDQRGRARRWFWRPGPLWAAATAVVCLVGTASLYLYAQRHLMIATETGEQRFVKLVDGTTLELNSRSRVRIRFSDSERDVDLIEGQALFHVTKDSARPFIVHSGSTLVRAVGTQFDVYRKASGTTVTVVEGRVAVLSPMLKAARDHGESGSSVAPQTSPLVSPSTNTGVPGDRPSPAPSRNTLTQRPDRTLLDAALSDAPNAVYLSAGEQITVSAKTVPRPTHADPTVATAWTQHELVFESTPLNEVAQDFNRYNTRQLIINDVALRNFHITGVFSSADPASLLKFLRAQHDLVIEEVDDDIRVSKK